jgi:hypothetical protein
VSAEVSEAAAGWCGPTSPAASAAVSWCAPAARGRQAPVACRPPAMMRPQAAAQAVLHGNQCDMGHACAAAPPLSTSCACSLPTHVSTLCWLTRPHPWAAW